VELERHFQRSAWQGDDNLVFPHPATGWIYDPAKAYRRFKAAARRAGLRRELRFHDLRHTFGVRMAAAGAPMRLVQAWMGHASVTTTEIYARFSPDPMQAKAWANRAFGGDRVALREDAAMPADAAPTLAVG
jgi:integrase